MKVVIIRHTSVAVPKGTCYGQTDVPLNVTFEEEAEETLKTLLKYKPFDAVYSSPLSRATRLAGYCGYTRPILDDRLKEVNFGEWEMQLYDEIASPLLQQWYDDYMNVVPPQGESYSMMYARIINFLEEVRTKNYQRVAVFAHSGVITCAELYVERYKIEDAIHHLPKYGEVVEIDL